MENVCDVIVIGAGPAGISASIYLKRDNINVLVFTTDNSVLKKAGVINNYYGVGEISGEELYNKGLSQAKGLEIAVLKEEVTSIIKNDIFEIHTNSGKYYAKSIVLATGVSRTNPRIKDIDKFEGKGVSYCATCDGFFFRNRKIAVVGNGNYAVEEIKQLMNATSDIVILTNGEAVSNQIKELNLQVIEDKIIGVKGNNKLEKIIFESSDVEVDALFVAIGVAGSANFSKLLGLEMDKNFIKVNSGYQTNLPGLFAIGDAIGGVLQIGKAVSDGIIASKEVAKYIKSI